MSNPAGADVARLMGDLAIQMQQQSDTESTLQSVVEGAVSIVPGARWAGISMVQGRSVVARAPSDPLVVELDELQSSLDEGPCLDALRNHHTVHIVDMAAETRWPQFTRRAAERGVGSLLSFRLFVRRETLGALNLYAGEAGVFDDDSMFVGEVLAQHASVALVGSNAESQFQLALTNRDVIGQAKGILMYRNKLTDLQSFQLLLRTSQHGNIKLVEVARWIVEEHLSALKSP